MIRLPAEPSLFVAAIAVLTLGGTLLAAEFHVDTEADRIVKFVSDAPFEDFDGTTDRIDGYIIWDGDTLISNGAELAGADFYFEVELDGLDTGIGLRNRHMREKYLETHDYPYVSFAGSVVHAIPSGNGGYSAETVGTFDLHGVKRERTLEVRIEPDSSGYLVTSSFDVSLKDHDIEIPKLMFLKINEIIAVEISFALKRVK